MAVIFFQDVGKYDKATFVCLQHFILVYQQLLFR